jgi:hypothetical protein
MDDLLQPFSTVNDAIAGQVTPVVPKQIEDDIRNRSGRAFLPLLQKLKPRYACRIQPYNFTIQNR